MRRRLQATIFSIYSIMNSNPEKGLYRLTGKEDIVAGLFIAAAGFEDRCLAFAKGLRRQNTNIDQCLLLRYQHENSGLNEANKKILEELLTAATGTNPQYVSVMTSNPLIASRNVNDRISALANLSVNRTAIVDVSSMTHLLALTAIHACVTAGLRTIISYTEARSY